MRKWIAAAVVSAAFCVAGLIFCLFLLYRGPQPASGQDTGAAAAAAETEQVQSGLSAVSTTSLSAPSGITEEQAASLPVNPADYSQSVWAVDWDEASALSYLETRHDKISEISIFAATFDGDGQVTLSDAAKTLHTDLKNRYPDKSYFLSITNDIISDGWAEAKDASILYSLLEDADTARTHAQELVSLAAEQDFDGVEIDYESIYGDTTLWNLLIRFEGMLAEEADARGLKIRVVLEPSIPTDQLQFSDQVEHVVMCYDSHGIGTEAGPKADPAFLSDIVSRFANVPNLSYALANGGYDWNLDTGYTEPFSMQAVEELLTAYGGEGTRDDTNGALLYMYTDGAGNAHQLWYGDEETLQTWRSMIEEQVGRPVSVSLWKA